MPTDTTVNNLVINKLTKAQYDAIQSPSDTELYLVPDVIDTTPTSGSDNLVTSGGVYTALSDKQDTLVSGTNIKTINNESILGSGNITIQGGGGQQQQADWSQSDSSAVDYIKNKPTNLVTGSLGECTVWSGTLADYNALGAHDPSTLYFITAAATPQNYTLWFGSAAEYAAIVTKDSSTLYFVTE